MAGIKKIVDCPIQIFTIFNLNVAIANQDRLYSHCISISDPDERRNFLTRDHGFKDVLVLTFRDLDPLGLVSQLDILKSIFQESLGQSLEPHYPFRRLKQLHSNVKGVFPYLKNCMSGRPTRAIIRKIVKYYTRTSRIATGYSIHCHVGMSRSAAAALIGFYLMTLNEELAMKKFQELREMTSPNHRMLDLFDRMYHANLKSVTMQLAKRFEDFPEVPQTIGIFDELDELPVIDE